MSLRVLLADESASIKKVFQLGLQDFAAEVKSVQSGVDVVEVAENFAPDIIFADILLQKKNGYEVCKELKNHATLNNIPVVLMWSSFMELDRQKYQECQAESEMEKPFEVDAMRLHIQSLVNRTKSQHLSSFLKFPDSIKDDFVQELEEQKENYLSNPPPTEIEERAPEVPNVIIPPPPQASVDGLDLSVVSAPLQEQPGDGHEISQNSVFNHPTEDFSAELEQIEEDEPSPVPLQTLPPEAQSPLPQTPLKVSDHFELDKDDTSMEEWRTKDLADNVISIEDKELDKGSPDQFQSVELKADENLDLEDFLYKPDEYKEDESPPIVEVHTLDYSEEDGLAPTSDGAVTTTTDNHQIKVDSSEIEAIVRAHAQEIIKLNIQEMLPQIIEKITREELEKLLIEELKIKS